MRLLRIKVDGLPLYKDSFEVKFYAMQRVMDTHLDSVSRLFGNIYINSAEAIIGINASGKTTALKVVSYVGALLAAKPLNSVYLPSILADDKVTIFEIDYFSSNNIIRIISEVICEKQQDGSKKTRILSEKVWVKPVTTKTNKSNLLDFQGIELFRERNNSEEYLSEDVSITIALNRIFQDTISIADLMVLTDFNVFFPEGNSVASEIISLFDPTIEYISVNRVNGKLLSYLKFHNAEDPIICAPDELNKFLSSGTVKGITVFSEAIQILKSGGYLIVDEIENHFNEELVVSLLRLFLNKKTNPKGAVIVFSTHYPELLDELDRNDSVYITRSADGLLIHNLNSLLKRNDLTKSEVYQSDFLGGTAPKYSALMGLRKSIIKTLEE